jgi:predicted ABC-type ATPase
MTQPRMYIYRGLPGSGKTSRAIATGADTVPYHTSINPVEQLQYRNTREILVGRDHIRKGLGIEGGVGTPNQENQVTQLQYRIISAALRAGKSVHVDDMNLKESYVTQLKKLADKNGVVVEIVDLRDMDVEVCIKHDLHRHAYGGHYVGEARIRELHRRYILKKSSGPKRANGRRGMPESYKPQPHIQHDDLEQAVLIDLDGTVALKSPERGFYDYDDRVSLDLPNKPVIYVVRGMIHRGWYPIFLSGRMDSCATATRMWIQKHVYCGEFDLYMRKTGDHRPDYEVKDELFTRYVQGHYNVTVAFDDRNQVVDLWRAKGITTMQVADGAF